MRKNRHRGTGALIKIAFRNIWRNMRRTVFCIISVGAAVFFIVFYRSFRDGMNNSINEVVQIFETGHVKVVSAAYEAENEYLPVQYPVANGENAEELVRRILSIDGVKAVFPRISSYATLQESILKHAVLWGLKIDDEMASFNFNLAGKNNGLVEGHYPVSGSNECAVGLAFARKTGLKIGDRIPLKTVSAHFSDKLWSPQISGIFDFQYGKVDQETIMVDFERLRQLLVLDGGAQQLVVFADNEGLSSAIAEKIRILLKEIPGSDDVVGEWEENYWIAWINSAKPMYFAIYFIFIIVASFLIVNTVVMIVNERIKEIGMMGSLGMTRGEIVTVFFFESLFLSAIGAFAGVFLGGLVTGILQFFPISMADVAGDVFNGMPINNTLFLNFSIISLVQAWFMGVGVASVFTLFPSLKSAFVEPVEALRR